MLFAPVSLVETLISSYDVNRYCRLDVNNPATLHAENVAVPWPDQVSRHCHMPARLTRQIPSDHAPLVAGESCTDP